MTDLTAAASGSPPRRAWLAGAVVGVLTGATMVTSRAVMPETDPATLAWLRYAIAFGWLLPALPRAGLRQVAATDLPWLLLLGVGQFGLVILLRNVGLRTVPAGRAALIFASLPALTLLFAWVAGGARPTGARLTGVGLALGGVLGVEGMTAITDGGDWIGQLALLGSAMVAAVCSVAYRPMLRRYSTLTIGLPSMLAAVLALGVWLALRSGPPHWPSGPQGWVLVAMTGTSSGMAFLLWLWALARLDATRIALLLNLSPPTALLAGAWFLDEPITLGLPVGLACILLGLRIAR